MLESASVRSEWGSGCPVVAGWVSSAVLQSGTLACAKPTQEAGGVGRSRCTLSRTSGGCAGGARGAWAVWCTQARASVGCARGKALPPPRCWYYTSRLFTLYQA